ncbi:MAG TPA: ABC transporter substrate-binding protein, partial [Candidatus Saccharimonadales bacterium]
HDGKPLTSDDVVFTFNTIKNPESRSPYFNTWQNIAIAATDTRTITFTLPSSLAVFPHYLTTGLIPEHLLKKVDPANLRSAAFNTRTPVGAGPFTWRGLQVEGNDPSDREEQVALVPFDHYIQGRPKLNEFIVRIFVSQERLAEVFADGQLHAAAGLDSVPKGAPDSTVENNMPLSAGTYVFFKTTTEPLNSVKVRQALVAGSNQTAILDKLGYMTRPVNGPLLTRQQAYDKRYAQKTNDPATAKRLLAEDGWVAGPDGMLTKNGKPLSFALVATDTAEYRMVAKELRKQWKAIGVNASAQLLNANDYSTALAGHTYDATLHGISIGSDPDVYAFWHSSQADVRSNARLNLSEWNNKTADSALDAGRSRHEPALRTVKYAPFLQAWQQDAPALGLYQPRYLYVTRDTVYGLTDNAITSSVNRYNGVENWQIRTARVTQK